MPVAYDHPETYGQDRLLAAYGASELHGRPCIVLDAGTCVTCDAVPTEGGIHPIAIAPGLQTLMAGMGCAAPQLRAAIASGDPRSVADAPRGARSTDDCIRFGLRSQLAGMCHECIAAACDVLGPAG